MRADHPDRVAPQHRGRGSPPQLVGLLMERELVDHDLAALRAEPFRVRAEGVDALAVRELHHERLDGLLALPFQRDLAKLPRSLVRQLGPLFDVADVLAGGRQIRRRESHVHAARLRGVDGVLVCLDVHPADPAGLLRQFQAAGIPKPSFLGRVRQVGLSLFGRPGLLLKQWRDGRSNKNC